MDLKPVGQVALAVAAAKGTGLAVTRILLEEGARVMTASRTSSPTTETTRNSGGHRCTQQKDSKP
ncbi:hypothetical protein [Candidatus Protofrankia californiensis]|uniref:hypothetical protein n=1 Tax=Candidatus Protofrankia californiensis TaxID=1839754 RepID=UPI0010417359|nr:hypothetical protein [Candidatus Protofrankia californiensis]